jgi:hypothetical protein
MRNRHAVPAALVLTALMGMLGCGTDPHAKGDTLDIEASPLPSAFRVGDTSSFWTISKTVILANGRPDRNPDYFSYRLASSDTNVVGIVEDKRLVGRKEGSAEVKAIDTKSNLVSQTSVTVTVSAR